MNKMTAFRIRSNPIVAVGLALFTLCYFSVCLVEELPALIHSHAEHDHSHGEKSESSHSHGSDSGNDSCCSNASPTLVSGQPGRDSQDGSIQCDRGRLISSNALQTECLAYSRGFRATESPPPKDVFRSSFSSRAPPLV